MSDFKAGDRVRFIKDNLGTITVESGPYKFGGTVGSGDEGEVLEVDYNVMLPGWIAVRPDSHPDGYVPVTADMIEKVV